MRKLLVALPLLLLWACSQKEMVIIEGKINGVEGKTLYLDRLHTANTEVIDSVEIGANGKFKFKAENVQPEFYLLRLSNGKLITLLAEAREKIVLDINGDNMPEEYTVEGSKGSNLVKELNHKLIETKRKLAALRAKFEKEKNDPDFSNLSKGLLSEYTRVLQEQREFSGNFIMKNATSLASYMALYQKLDDKTFTLNENDDIKFVRIVASSMKALYPEHEYTKAILANLATLQKQLDNLQMAQLIEEKAIKFPNISLPDARGKEISLQSLMGKFIILSYWASQDPGSRKQNKTLKKIYAKYHKKGLGIYHVSIDRNENLWKQAVQEDQLNFINVCDPDTGSAKAITTFNVQQIPANYLIDKQGEIVGKNLFGIALEEKIAEYLR